MDVAAPAPAPVAVRAPPAAPVPSLSSVSPVPLADLPPFDQVLDGAERDAYLSDSTQRHHLNDQPFIRKAMGQFVRWQANSKYQICTNCKARVFVNYPAPSHLRGPIYYCFRCQSSKKRCKFGPLNNMDPGPVPPELQGLTQLEEMLISRGNPIMRIYTRPGGQHGYRGHVLSLSQNIKDFARRLPHDVQDLAVLVVRRPTTNNQFVDLKVRRQRVLDALLWLRNHNPLYSDIQIDQARVASLPLDGQVDVPAIDAEAPADIEPVLPHVPPPPSDDYGQDEFFLPLGEDVPLQRESVMQALNSDDDSSATAGAGVAIPPRVPSATAAGSSSSAATASAAASAPIPWPAVSDDPYDEFQTPHLASLCFPTLFPTGKGDFTFRGRRHEVSEKDALNYLMCFHDSRFATHPRFPFFALNPSPASSGALPITLLYSIESNGCPPDHGRFAGATQRWNSQ